MKPLIPQHAPEPPRCRGASLIELMVVIALLGVLISATGGMLHRLIRLEQAVRHDRQGLNAIHLAGPAFRRDVRVARTAMAVDEGVRLTLQSGDTIEYRSDGAVLTRTQTSAAGTRLHQDRWNLPEGRWRLAATEEGAHTAWRLEMTRPSLAWTIPAQRIPALPPVIVSATVGASWRPVPSAERDRP